MLVSEGADEVKKSFMLNLFMLTLTSVKLEASLAAVHVIQEVNNGWPELQKRIRAKPPKVKSCVKQKHASRFDEVLEKQCQGNKTGSC